MNAAPEREPHHRMLHHKMKDSYGPTYLTVLSLIQGVALTDLAVVVSGDYEQFTLVHWLLVLINIGVLIVILNVYTVQSILWDWIPDLRDAVIVITFGALELFLNHTIPVSMIAWLLGLAGICMMGVLGTWHIDWRAKMEPENSKLLSFLKDHHRLFAHYLLGNTVLLLLLAWGSRLAGLEAADVQGIRGVLTLALVLLVALCLGGATIIAHWYWHKAVKYARTGQVPDSRKTRSEDYSSL
jgi:hypothetical protein